MCNRIDFLEQRMLNLRLGGQVETSYKEEKGDPCGERGWKKAQTWERQGALGSGMVAYVAGTQRAGGTTEK